MYKKYINFNVELLSVRPTPPQYVVDEVMSDDINSVVLNFNITDIPAEELANATARVLVYSRDGSLSQNLPTDTELNGTTFSYVVKERELLHVGVTQVELIVNIGTVRYSSKLHKFDIKAGLNYTIGTVAREIIITDWEAISTDIVGYLEGFIADEALRAEGFTQSQADRATTFGESEASRLATFNSAQNLKLNEFDASQTARQEAFVQSQADKDVVFAGYGTQMAEYDKTITTLFANSSVVLSMDEYTQLTQNDNVLPTIRYIVTNDTLEEFLGAPLT